MPCVADACELSLQLLTKKKVRRRARFGAIGTLWSELSVLLLLLLLLLLRMMTMTMTVLHRSVTQTLVRWSLWWIPR
jgi:hypothetical protein